MTELPHLFVRVKVECDGKPAMGISADGLPPKWFTKNPHTHFEQDDLPQMLRVIRHAADLAVELKDQPNLFAWWWQLYQGQHAWAVAQDVPPLLAGLGVSLVERAVIDAFCRANQRTLFQSLRSNRFGIDLSIADDSLRGVEPGDVLPTAPLRRVQLRHTVGLGDPLTDDDIDAAEKLEDQLPHSLVDNIKQYGLRRFKIKLQGDLGRDRQRLVRLATIIGDHAGPTARVTLDANEQYDNIDAFRSDWESLQSSPAIRDFLDVALLFVEQPLHRDRALEQHVGSSLSKWAGAPPIIIDESDATLESLPTALRLGYSGTSHKNCKGIFKGVISAARIAEHRRHNPKVMMSAEDLANVGPVALLQDLAMVAALGINHVERNGHHYFRGLSQFPEAIQRQMIDDHGDLYHRHTMGFATLAIRQGELKLDSVNQAPFGTAEIPDLRELESWTY